MLQFAMGAAAGITAAFMGASLCGALVNPLSPVSLVIGAIGIAHHDRHIAIDGIPDAIADDRVQSADRDGSGDEDRPAGGHCYLQVNTAT